MGSYDDARMVVKQQCRAVLAVDINRGVTQVSAPYNGKDASSSKIVLSRVPTKE